MALGLIGKKVGMTQIFDENGLVVPVTVIQAGPCPVVQRKTSELTDRVKKVKLKNGTVLEVKVRRTEGYDAAKLGFGDKTKNVSKPEQGLARDGSKPQKVMREFRLADGETAETGSVLRVDFFQDAGYVDITGISKGHGFQGVIKRHHFSAGPKSHGSNSVRAPGSIGMNSYPAKVFKGKKMPGHMGDERVTMQNLKVVNIDLEKNLILVKGSVPGSKNSLLLIKKSVKKGAAKK
ncbi:MAG TPA: 50S ribosomal protein L3 [Spirochaetota bacterium]|nr:50S ribosomal protein L3 [Spirochaetota bacterium]